MFCPACQQEIESPSGSDPTGHCSHCGASLLSGLERHDECSATPDLAQTGIADTTAAALAYITFVPAVLFLVMEPYKQIALIRFHSIQSIGLFVLWCLVRYAVVLPFWPMGFLTRAVLDAAVLLLFFALWLICVLKAVKGEFFKLPVLGEIALRQSRG
ncbi:MAG TPA: hypothetical protein VG714_10255 [Acidobacteriaceae bacterium]|nr:hypothetical protein [Acidobacteriaceae bacterium]